VSGAAIIPGNHDGVHLGHRALVAAARAHAGPRGLRTVALTFDPHPLAVLAPERAPASITSVARRRELLRDAGCDEVVVARFDAAYAAQPADLWVEDALAGALGARAVVVGPDFRFGRGGAGSIARLRELGGSLGFEVVEVPPVVLASGRVSSTRVRQALGAGEVRLAAELLGRVHEVDGRVVEGHRRGRTIGVPTANLDPDPVLVPADGVYAVLVRLLEPAGPRFFGVANLGVRPTFAAGRSVEAHLLDFEGDLYGARLRVGFVARLRGEQKFDSVASLRAQVEEDVRAARALFAHEETTWSSI